MIRIYSKKEIEIMKKGGKILAKILEKVAQEVKVGNTTNYLNKIAEDLVFKYGAKPSFKGYMGFPKSLCVSINEQIVHGVPGNRIIKDKDIVGLDLGIRYKGYCTDMALTVIVGNPDKKVKKLVGITQEALEMSIEQLKQGNYLRDIGAVIQKHVEKNGFNVVRELVGHGVGKNVHEDPQVLNYAEGGKGIELKQGMVLAIEPMVVMGDWLVEKDKDGFCYKTRDNSLSAHFEHTIAVGKDGGIILTKN